ncbi:sortase domain-bontaining protein [uncultured Adlercreutzia sp.]|uniref:sortase domain-containing protein n=1 Tax=uncultured Adlercreutzia sp. TaxID=875803 RepID=UPI0026F37E8E|nr:hypothetical protein [uncultured Adlercreutzia sp.]
MKAPKLVAVVASSAAALCLAAGLAYATEYTDPTTAPMPEKARDTSIAQQVTSILVYQDQEEAEAMATEFSAIHDELALDAVANRANLAYQHSAAGEAAKAEADAEADTEEADEPTADEASSEEAVEPMDVTEPLEVISPKHGEDAMDPATIDVNGDIMDYIDSYETASAPTSGAGLWMGSDSTVDGSWGYFIGHNPGSFTCVMTLKNGDPVTVCDSEGRTRTYHVVDEFIVPDDTYWEDIQSRVTEYGESIILQTCCGDNAHYRVVIAD